MKQYHEFTNAMLAYDLKRDPHMMPGTNVIDDSRGIYVKWLGGNRFSYWSEEEKPSSFGRFMRNMAWRFPKGL